MTRPCPTPRSAGGCPPTTREFCSAVPGPSGVVQSAVWVATMRRWLCSRRSELLGGIPRLHAAHGSSAAVGSAGRRIVRLWRRRHLGCQPRLFVFHRCAALLMLLVARAASSLGRAADS